MIPTDRTLLREENGAIWVIYGKAKFHVPDPATLARLFPDLPTLEIWNGGLDNVTLVPVDGTTFREESHSQVVLVVRGHKVPAQPGPRGTINKLWDGALSQIP
jgi:hypothetical protein